ncbi:MAG: T9SS type A sorting domain-containing protein [bacterium]|nr:T9SS type A sorting domain-containing protein [bacterium]
MGLIFVGWGSTQAATLSVNHDGSETYLTIQSAIDVALAGDTIEVASGHYEEQLVFENLTNIMIAGAGQGITFIDSPAILTESVSINTYPQYPVIIVSNCDGINFSGLTLDGRGQGSVNVPFHGFGYFDSGGSLTDVHITRIREEPLSYDLHGNGVFAVAFDGVNRNLDFTNVELDDFQKTGILLHGLGLHSVSSNVNITGQGLVVAPVQNGWQVSAKAELVASYCSVSDVSYEADTWTATGMLGLEGTKLTLTECSFDSCESSLYVFDNTTSYIGGQITNSPFNGIVGKSLPLQSLASQSELEELPAQPIELESDQAKAGGPLILELADLDLVGIGVNNSWGVAVISDNEIELALDDVRISQFAMGLVTYEALGVVTGQARDCTFFDNYPLAAFSTTAIAYDARYNNWGDPTGPFHPVTNPGGLGNEVYDNIQYQPFNGAGGLFLTPSPAGPVACGDPVTYTVSYAAGPATPDLFLYNIEIHADGTLGTPHSPVTFNPWGGTELFLHYDNGNGSYTVTGSTTGGNPQPLTGPGVYDLFTIECVALADGGGLVSIENVTLRDPSNTTFPATVDGDSLIADCLAPAAVTNIEASPHHNRIGISWDHNGLDVDHFEVYSGLWHDGGHVSIYPEYDDIPGNTIPTRPVDYNDIQLNPLGEWVLVTSSVIPEAEHTWSDSSKRGIYYYEVFAVDAVGNASAVAPENDRASNYWLGDVFALNGTVDVLDISVLGDSFGESEGDAFYDNTCDVGPTDNSNGFGIPETDNTVGFEDLMIFAINFGEVSPTGKTDALIFASANLQWIEKQPGQYSLNLWDGSGIKGIRVKADLPAGAIHSVTSGNLLASQSSVVFLKNTGTSLDANLAIMGRGTSLVGLGELLVINSNLPLAAKDLEIEIRGHDNSEVQHSLDQSGSPVTPRVFSLNANHPNPFNPRTRISFSLPEAQAVKLVVYGIDGRKVATLVDENRIAGEHEVIWEGQDNQGQTVASGTYFYRIEAGNNSKVRKMTLMK